MIAAKIFGGVVAAIIIAAIVEAYLKRNKHRSLSSSFADKAAKEVKPELGMEATNTKPVDDAHERNEKQSRFNNQLSRRL